MKIQIIGTGMVGSTIAFNLLKENIGCLHLVDVNYKKVEQDINDLERTKIIEKLSTQLSFSSVLFNNGFDYNIISLGERSDKKGYETRNWFNISKTINAINGGKIIIVTNPARELSIKAKKTYPNKDIDYVGDLVDTICDGKEIMKYKGFNNWGISSEVLRYIKMGVNHG